MGRPPLARPGDVIGTALSFHQVSILGEQGLTPLEAAANFIPQTGAGLAATLATGMLVDRVRPRLVLALSMASLVSAILLLPLVGPGVWRGCTGRPAAVPGRWRRPPSRACSGPCTRARSAVS